MGRAANAREEYAATAKSGGIGKPRGALRVKCCERVRCISQPLPSARQQNRLKDTTCMTSIVKKKNRAIIFTKLTSPEGSKLSFIFIIYTTPSIYK